MPTKLKKGEFVYNTLRLTADQSQKGLRAYLVSVTGYNGTDTDGSVQVAFFSTSWPFLKSVVAYVSCS